MLERRGYRGAGSGPLYSPNSGDEGGWLREQYNSSTPALPGLERSVLDTEPQGPIRDEAEGPQETTTNYQVAGQTRLPFKERK